MVHSGSSDQQLKVECLFELPLFEQAHDDIIVKAALMRLIKNEIPTVLHEFRIGVGKFVEEYPIYNTEDAGGLLEFAVSADAGRH